MRNDLLPSEPLRLLARIGALSILYFLAGKLGLLLAFVHPSATAVWPPSGIALAALLLGGYALWPGIFLGAFFVNLTTAGSLLTTLGISIGNTLEPLIGAWLVSRFAGGCSAFARAGSIVRFAVVAAGLSTLVSATAGVSSLVAGGYASWADFRNIWVTWWLGDAVGILLVTPLVVLWWAEPRLEWASRQRYEAGLLLASLVVVSGIVFQGFGTVEPEVYPLDFLYLPFLIWVGLRFSQREAATINVALGALAIWATLQGRGPFSMMGAPGEELRLLQAYVGLLSIMSLVIAAVVRELTLAEARMRRWNAELERRVAEQAEAMLRSQERLQAMASELTLAEHRERRQLASELHDYLAQLLVLCRLKLNQAGLAASLGDRAGPWQEVDRLLEQAMNYTRTLVAQLTPQALHKGGLPAALQWLANQMRAHGLEVHIRLEADMPPLSENEAVLIYQSARELLLNVIKHAGVQTATVTLAVEDGTVLHVTVRDEGRGFEPSDPIGASSRPDQFGLSSIRDRTEAMGGTIRIESGPGRGTRVTLLLPLQARGATEDAAVSPVRLILADDHVMFRQGLRSLIETYSGFEIVGEAADGEEAVELVRALRPDIVIMDVNMPKMNGIDATTRIRQEAPGTKVIGLSCDISTTAAMVRAGALTQLDKSQASGRLYQIIRDSLGQDPPAWSLPERAS